MAEEKEKEVEGKVTPAQEPEGLLAVEVVELVGYHRGAHTHFGERQALALEKAGAVKIRGRLDKTHKLLPLGGKK